MAVVTQPGANQQLLVPWRDTGNGPQGSAGASRTAAPVSKDSAVHVVLLPCMMCRLATRLDECCCMPFCVAGAILPMRTKVRTMGGIRGSICNDCLASVCCLPCAVCQLSREMDNMGL